METAVGSCDRFEELAVRQGLCTQAQLEDARATCAELQKAGHADSLSSILVRKGYLTKAQVSALEFSMMGTQLFGNFEILEPLCRGSVWTVYRARQIETNHVVALKVLDSNLSQNPGIRDRFLHEAGVLAGLEHANLVKAVDFGEVNGRAFVAMSFTEGQTCSEILAQQGRLPFDEALRIIRQLCGALTYAHSLRLYDCNLKPENIMVTRDGAVKLCDFGMTHTAPPRHDSALNLAEHIVDTPFYAAPEEILGQPVDARSDIYGLGAVFYHLLTGQPLFSGATPTSIMVEHVTDTAPAVTDLVANIPSSYARIVTKMLAKPPEDRYQTIAALVMDLDAAAAGRTTSADQFHAVSSCALPAGSSPWQPSRGTLYGPFDSLLVEEPVLPERNSRPSNMFSATTADVSKIEWSDRFNLGVSEVDAQHKWWFRITRSFLQQALERVPNEAEIHQILAQLIRYARYHFKAEEEFMSRIHYPAADYRHHLTVHHAFVARVSAIAADLRAGKPRVTRELAAFLVGWLMHHILEVDVKYIRFHQSRKLWGHAEGGRS